MQKTTILIVRILGALLVLVTLPAFFTIALLSLMAFDSVDPGLRAWVFSGVVILLCIAIPAASLFFSWRWLGRQQVLHGILVSLAPAGCLALLWIWLSQQSFS